MFVLKNQKLLLFRVIDFEKSRNCGYKVLVDSLIFSNLFVIGLNVSAKFSKCVCFKVLFLILVVC